MTNIHLEHRLLRQRNPEQGRPLPETTPATGEGPETAEDPAARKQRQAELKAKEDQDRRGENPDAVLDGDVVHGTLHLQRAMVPRDGENRFDPENFLQLLKNSMREFGLPIDDTVSQYVYKTGEMRYMRCQRPDGSVQLYEFADNGPRLARQAPSLAALQQEDNAAIDRLPGCREHIGDLVNRVADMDREWAAALRNDPTAEPPKTRVDETLRFFSENWETWDARTRSVVSEYANNALAAAGLQTPQAQEDRPTYAFIPNGGDVILSTYRSEHEQVLGSGEDAGPVPNDELPDGQRIISPVEQARIDRALVDLRRSPADVAAFNGRSRIASAELRPHYRTVNTTGNNGAGPRESALDPSWTDLKVTLRSGSTQSVRAFADAMREAFGEFGAAGMSPAERTLSFSKLDAAQVRQVLDFTIRWEAAHQEALSDTGPFTGMVIRNRAEVTQVWNRLEGGQRRYLMTLLQSGRVREGAQLELAHIVEKLTPHFCDCMLAGGPLDDRGRADLARLVPNLTPRERDAVAHMPIGRRAMAESFPERQA